MNNLQLEIIYWNLSSALEVAKYFNIQLLTQQTRKSNSTSHNCISKADNQLKCLDIVENVVFGLNTENQIVRIKLSDYTIQTSKKKLPNTTIALAVKVKTAFWLGYDGVYGFERCE
ncbi:Hypothetical_protein [Hexamita inflata]|uniref:Hypothetical_protein n=1 Tax=Hexamita inflata TaxID=28002 RepID=A0AA86TDV3_9EUKA|nr:Hypothetical protein HINF_LOCUS3599 [Hexamita inflata]